MNTFISRISKNGIYAVLGMIAFMGVSCKTIKPERPAESYSQPTFVPQPSVINIPFELKEAELEKLVNESTPELLFEDNSLEDNGGDNLMVKAWKKGKIDMRFNGNSIQYKVPLKLWIKAGFKVEQFGLSLSKYEELKAEMSLTLKTAFSIKEDWSLVTSTTFESYEWISKPTLTVAGYNLPITTIADMVVKSQKKSLGPQLDAGIKSGIDMKKMMQKAWEDLQMPMMVSPEYKLWLKVAPKSVVITPLVTDKGSIKASVGISTVTETAMGAMPAFAINKELPKIKIVNKTDDKFIINLYHEMTYPVIDSLARSYVVNQTFTQGKRSVTVTDMHVFGNNEKMIVEATLVGSVKGKVYLSALPYFNAETNTLELKEVEFDIKTKNVLLKSASWLFDGGFNKLIESKVKFPLTETLNTTKTELEKSLTNNKVAKGIVVNGKISKLEVKDLALTPSAMRIVVLCEGKLNVTMGASK